MIIDSLPNMSRYLTVHPLFHVVAAFVHSHRLEDLEIGTSTIGSNIRVLVAEYDTVDAAKKFIECHRREIDVQIIVSGIEECGVCDRSACTTTEEYREDKDLEKLSGEMDFVTLRPDRFAIFFPNDAHMPGLISRGKASRVRKVVFKVPV